MTRLWEFFSIPANRKSREVVMLSAGWPGRERAAADVHIRKT